MVWAARSSAGWLFECSSPELSSPQLDTFRESFSPVPLPRRNLSLYFKGPPFKMTFLILKDSFFNYQHKAAQYETHGYFCSVLVSSMKCTCHFPYKEEYFLILLIMRALREELLKIFHYLRELLAETLHSQLICADKLIEIKEIPLMLQ